MGTTGWIQPDQHLQAARGHDPPPPPRHHHRSMALREAARWGIARVKRFKRRQCFGSEPIVSHPTLSSSLNLPPACRAVASELQVRNDAIVDHDGSKPHAPSCTSSDRPQSDGVHRLRMADSQGRARCKTSAARQRLEWFRRQIVTSSESPVDSEPPVDLFSALLTLLTLTIECRLRRRLCYRKPTCTEFRQPPLSPHPKLGWSWGLRGFNVDITKTNTNDNGPWHPAHSSTLAS